MSELLVFILMTLFVYLLISYNWKRRWLYFYSWKIPGPIAFPIIGSSYIMYEGPKEVINTIIKLFGKYGPVGKVWIGPTLLIGTTRLQDIEIILSQNLNKGDFYELGKELFNRSLLISPVNLWRERRKIINQTFSTNVINSFFPILNKYSLEVNKSLIQFSQTNEDPADIFLTIWKVTFESACETLGDVDAHNLKNKDEFLQCVYRYEKILTKRFYNPFLHNNFLWEFSRLQKKAVLLSDKARDFVQQIIDLNKQSSNKKEMKYKRFFPYLMELQNSKKLSKEAILEEGPLMLLASSETSAVVTSTVLMLLGIYPDIQAKIHEELSAVLGSTEHELTLEEVNHLNYLERVLKESMRIIPPIPFIVRTLEKNYHIEPYIFPEGARMFFPITVLHKNADLWPDPLKFDPDRFLPEEIKKQNRCAYIPFSYGARNCIGFKYAMFATKILLANILKTYKVVESLDYKRIEDIDFEFMIVAKAKKGYRVRLAKR